MAAPKTTAPATSTLPAEDKWMGYDALDFYRNNPTLTAFGQELPQYQKVRDAQLEKAKAHVPTAGEERYGFVQFGKGMNPDRDNRSFQEKFSKTEGAGLWAAGINPDDPQAEQKAKAMLDRLLANKDPKYHQSVWGDKEWGRDDLKVPGIRQLMAQNPNIPATQLIDYAWRAPQAQNALQPNDIGGMIGDTLAEIALTVMSGGNPTLAVMYGAAKGGSDTGSLLGAGLGGLGGLGTGLGTGSFMQGVTAAGGGLGGAASYMGSGLKTLANNFLHPIDFLTRTGTGLVNGVSQGLTNLGHGFENVVDALGRPIQTAEAIGHGIASLPTTIGNYLSTGNSYGNAINNPSITGTTGLRDAISNSITPTFESGVQIPGVVDPYLQSAANALTPSLNSIGRGVDAAGLLKNVSTTGLKADPLLSNAAATQQIMDTAGNVIDPKFQSTGTMNSPITNNPAGTVSSSDRAVDRAMRMAEKLTAPSAPATPTSRGITSGSMLPATSDSLPSIAYKGSAVAPTNPYVSPVVLAAANENNPLSLADLAAFQNQKGVPVNNFGFDGMKLNLDGAGGIDLGLGGAGLRGLGFAAGGPTDGYTDPMNPMGGPPKSQFGLAALEKGGATEDKAPVEGYLDGPGDGMSDSIVATIDGHQPARLADGEFVIPADVVSGLGNGSSKAGAKVLYAMMDRVRQARTGNPKQGKEIKAEKFLPA